LDDETAQRALAQLRQGELVAMPGCGHAIHRTCPDDFLEVVLEFLARLDRPATGEYVGLEHPAG
jgi:pimeloyl-ACP methyl ester carboxylesterase